MDASKLDVDYTDKYFLDKSASRKLMSLASQCVAESDENKQLLLANALRLEFWGAQQNLRTRGSVQLPCTHDLVWTIRGSLRTSFNVFSRNARRKRFLKAARAVVRAVEQGKVRGL